MTSIDKKDRTADKPGFRPEQKVHRGGDVARLAARDHVYATMLRKRNAIPRNLRQGVYRGGRRRLDIFYRIHAGIPGSPMPGVGGTTPGAAGTVTEEEIWKIVDYVQSLPYEPESGPNEPRTLNALPVAR